ncbi:MAG: chloride channel protein [Myxococcota bacterium]
MALRARAAFRYFCALLTVALGAALFAIAFRWLLSLAFSVSSGAADVVSMFQRLPVALRLLLPAFGGLLAGGAALVMARVGRGQGVGDVMEAVVFGRVRLSMGTTLLKSVGSWFAIVTGGSVGREGPLIQFGGALGGVAGRLFGVDENRARALMAAGTAAGFAAAYNTPLAAILFVLEVVTGIVAMDAVLSTVVATALATAMTKAVVGGGPIYGQRTFSLVGSGELLGYALLGLVAALAAQGFMRLLSAGESLFDRSRLPQPWRAALGGLLVGVVAIWLPQVTGNGYEPLNAMLDGAIPLGVVVWLLAAKSFATTASVSSGSPGGVFTPTLFLGAAVGICFQQVLAALLGTSPLGGPGAYALVGMAAMTAATTHAPMMAAVLVFELSGDYAIVVPLLLATGVATLVSRLMRADSIYSAELSKRGLTWELTLEGRRVFNGQTPPPLGEGALPALAPSATPGNDRSPGQ